MSKLLRVYVLLLILGRAAYGDVTTGLVLSLDGATGPLNGKWVDSVGGRAFTLYNAPSWDATIGGGSFIFAAGQSQYANTSLSLPSMGVWSIETWHQYASTPGLQACLVTEVITNNQPLNYMFGQGPYTTAFSFGYYAASDPYFFFSAVTALKPGTWYHLVGTFDGSVEKLYLNGELASSTPQTVASSSGGGGISLMTDWGGGGQTSNYWSGALAVVKIYNLALSASDVSTNYNNNKMRFGAPTPAPISAPTPAPTDPTPTPTAAPTAAPSAGPSPVPTSLPSPLPTPTPTPAPTAPTPGPTKAPSFKPTAIPTAPSPAPTAKATFAPTEMPTTPSAAPTPEPTPRPSRPTRMPAPATPLPTALPSPGPSLFVTTVAPTAPSSAPTPVITLAPSTPTFKPSAAPSALPTDYGLIPRTGRFYWTTFHAHSQCTSHPAAYSIKTVPLNVCRITSPYSSVELPGTSEMYTCAIGPARISIDNVRFSALTCDPMARDAKRNIVYHDSRCREAHKGVEGATGGYVQGACGDAPFLAREQMITKSYRSAQCERDTTTYRNTFSLDLELAETRGTFFNTCISFFSQGVLLYYYTLTRVSGDGFSAPLIVKQTSFGVADVKCALQPIRTVQLVFPVPIDGDCLKDPLYPQKFYTRVMYVGANSLSVPPAWYY